MIFYTPYHPIKHFDGMRIYSEDDAAGVARIFRNEDSQWFMLEAAKWEKVTEPLSYDTFYIAKDYKHNQIDIPFMSYERACFPLNLVEGGYIEAVTQWTSHHDLGVMNSEAD